MPGPTPTPPPIRAPTVRVIRSFTAGAHLFTEGEVFAFDSPVIQAIINEYGNETVTRYLQIIRN